MQRKQYIYFTVFIVFLSIFYVDLWHNGNTVSRLLPVKALAEKGTWCIDAYHEETIDKAIIDGHYYSEKAPLPALIVAPVYLLFHHFNIHQLMEGDDLLYLLGSIMMSVIPFIIFVMLIFNSLLAGKWNIYRAMIITTLLAFSTFVFTYAGTSFGHMMAGMWLVLSYIYIKEKNNYILSGLFAGLCFITEYPCGLILFIWPVILFYKTGKLKDVVLFYLGTAPAILFQFYYNYRFTGSPFDMLYNHQAIDFYHDPNTFIGFALPIPAAMWGLLFSQYRGWFIHAPLIMLFLAMIIKQTFKTPKPMIMDHLLPLIVASYLLFSSYRVWYGGWCFGPRHFVPLTALMLYHFAKYMDWQGFKKTVFYILSFLGIIYIWLDKTTLLYDISNEYAYPLKELILPAWMSGRTNPNNILSLLAGIDPSISAMIWLAVLTGGLLLMEIKAVKRSAY